MSPLYTPQPDYYLWRGNWHSLCEVWTERNSAFHTHTNTHSDTMTTIIITITTATTRASKLHVILCIASSKFAYKLMSTCIYGATNGILITSHCVGLPSMLHASDGSIVSAAYLLLETFSITRQHARCNQGLAWDTSESGIRCIVHARQWSHE